ARLDALARNRIFLPLGMMRSSYCPAAELHGHIAATANCKWREGEILAGVVHDANAHSLGGIAGHAGLFSTAPDIARLAVALLPPSEMLSERTRLLGPRARRLAAENQIEPSIGGHSIGWFTPPNGMLPAGDLLSRRSFGHTGFTGTSIVMDPELDLVLILLTNRVYVPGEGSELLKLRRYFAAAAAAAITE
ncbi:MAG TPA: serine hydrolase, partial [Chthonomonadales bacterium]|nr:serine hydrolase [Chthonomonadales bacterium]